MYDRATGEGGKVKDGGAGEQRGKEGESGGREGRTWEVIHVKGERGGRRTRTEEDGGTEILRDKGARI